MWIILGFLVSLSALALEPFEKLPQVKIVRVLPDNVVVLNRGIEDGILRNDHAKLSNDTLGFSSRAICIKTSGDLSYWKLYRIPSSEAFSLEYVYTIIGMADKEIPSPIDRIRGAEQEITDIEGKKDPGPDPFAVKTDLPQKLTERDLIQAITPEKRKLFVERAFNRDQLVRDLNTNQVSIFASPFAKQSINNGESLRYGFRTGNIASKYRLMTQFEQQQTKLEDPMTKESVSTRSTFGQAQFVIHHISESFSTLTLLNYASQRFSAVATPKNHWQFGLIGFTWHVYDSKNWEYVDLSYIPLYDARTTEVMRADGSIDEVKRTGLRHGFRLGMKTRINEKVAFENLLWVRPFQNPSDWKFEGDNLNLMNDLKLIFSLTDKLFFDYNLVFQKDKLWRTQSGLPESNTINSLNLRYDFSI